MLEVRLVELYLACTQPWLPFLAACELDMMMQVCCPSTRKMGEESEQFKDILGYLASSSPARGLCETLPQKPKTKTVCVDKCGFRISLREVFSGGDTWYIQGLGLKMAGKPRLRCILLSLTPASSSTTQQP